MARDYKNAGRQTTREASRVSTGGLGLVAGFALGFGTAVMLQVGVPKSGKTAAGQAAETPVPAEAQTADEGNPAAADTAGDKKTTFDFYKMLPNFEVVIPEQDKDVRRSGEVTKVEEAGTYVLQAGSFQTEKDADRLRARLALIGLESEVQTVTIDRDQTWHRVRIGPFSKLPELNDARRRLAENDLQALVIRVGE